MSKSFCSGLLTLMINKNMDYEKLYNEALERAKYCLTTDMDNSGHWAVKHIFPELKDSEDEKIKKGIIKFLIDVNNGAYTKSELEIASWIAWLEKQSKQKPIDKVEPKFHEDDWIVYKNDICQIVKREEGCNKLVTTFGIEKELVNERNLSHARLWTIKDAKDGDVLAYVTDEEDLWIMIYRSLYEPYEGHVHYHALLVNDNFSDKGTCCVCIDNLKPATKEQRDLLFCKMKEIGYEWDAEKKELKRIEQVDGFDAELNALLKKYEHLLKEEVAECLSFYLGVVQGEQKPKWTEEDDERLKFFARKNYSKSVRCNE